MLRRILGAYCAACPEVGYVQGLNFIAGSRCHRGLGAMWVHGSH